jgi:hypothetical protein
MHLTQQVSNVNLSTAGVILKVQMYGVSSCACNYSKPISSIRALTRPKPKVGFSPKGISRRIRPEYAWMMAQKPKVGFSPKGISRRIRPEYAWMMAQTGAYGWLTRRGLSA